MSLWTRDGPQAGHGSKSLSSRQISLSQPYTLTAPETSLYDKTYCLRSTNIDKLMQLVAAAPMQALRPEHWRIRVFGKSRLQTRSGITLAGFEPGTPACTSNALPTELLANTLISSNCTIYIRPVTKFRHACWFSHDESRHMTWVWGH
jgi:hypothetical protein